MVPPINNRSNLLFFPIIYFYVTRTPTNSKQFKAAQECQGIFA